MIKCRPSGFPALILSKSPAGTLVTELHEVYGNVLVRYLTARFGDSEEAKEIAQEAWLRIFRLRDPELLSNPRAFLFQTATNLGIDRARHRKLEQNYRATAVSEEEPLTPGTEQTVAQRQSLTLIEQSLQMLPEKCRRAFILHRLHGNTYPQIADELGVSESSVEKYIIQALKAFRAQLATAEQPAAPVQGINTSAPGLSGATK